MTIKEKALGRLWIKTGKMDDARIASQTPVGGIHELTDFDYVGDGHRGHLLDIYYPEGTTGSLPVIIDIHGGGFMYGYKELNKYYNLYLASLGYTVIAPSYRLVPEVRFKSQVQDVMAVYKWVHENAAQYHCDLENVFVIGDSAGAMLAVMSALVNELGDLQALYQVEKSGLRINALGLTSGAMVMTTRSLSILNSVVFGEGYKKSAIYQSIFFDRLQGFEKLPPCYLVTSKEDFVTGSTNKFVELLESKKMLYRVHVWPKGLGKRLDHVFSVTHWEYPESVQTIDEMTSFFAEFMTNRL